MNKGTDVPAAGAATPPDRFEAVRQAHATAIKAYDAAQRAYVEQVNALPLPALMAGAKVRVTDMDDLATVVSAAHESAGTVSQLQKLLLEVCEYRTARRRIAAEVDLGRFAEAVVNAAAEMIRLGEGRGQ